MDEILKVSKNGQYRVRLVDDPFQGEVNPRTNRKTLCHAVTAPGTRFIDVDERPGPLSDGWDRVKGHRYDQAVKIFTRWARIFHGAVTLDDRPHDGANAVWYMMPAQFTETTDPAGYLKCERDEYRAWAAGEVYGFVIENSFTWTPADGSDGELTTWGTEHDSYGYIGYSYAESAALDEFKHYDNEEN